MNASRSLLKSARNRLLARAAQFCQLVIAGSYRATTARELYGNGVFKHGPRRRLLLLSAALLVAAGQQAAISDAQRAALDRISAQSLEANLAFIASDELKGRGTPSPGLETAAAYIAEQFRKAGLEPAGDDGYFQQARHPKAKNVVGILRGSDPNLRNTCVVLSAHYDHLGVRRGRIYNGANDDGSGTVSVIEIARALAGLNPHPGRTIVFAAFFGEELGMVGSRYYVQHPACPITATVADLNLEQLGRTDSSEGTRVASAALTGFDLTTISQVMEEAGAATGIRIYNDPKNSDAFFYQSDNASFSDAGVPSTTLAVTFLFPDYHRPGDKVAKIDFANMARVDCAVALGLLLLADSDRPPRWNAGVMRGARYANPSRVVR